VTVLTNASVSLDGYLAGPDETGFDQLFAWYDAGDKEYPSANPRVRFRLTEPDHRYLARIVDGVGVFVVGKRLFDLTNGWDGVHPFNKPIVVVTHHRPDRWVADHPGAPFTFVDHLPGAVERALSIADGHNVMLAGGTIARQCLELGLLDEICLDLVPVLLGGGTPFFDRMATGPHVLDDPTVVPGDRVTHLRYAVRKSG
jgi:dihydrofolate reductase